MTKNSKAFTLIEILLYLSIAVIVLFAITTFLSVVLDSRIKNEVILEVEQQGADVMELIKQTIRNANGINLPAQGNNENTLSLQVSDGTKNPTVFSTSSEVLQIKEGSQSPIPITSSRVRISDLVFRNMSKAGTPGLIRIEFTLRSKNPEEKIEYEYLETFYGSASLR